MDPTASALTGGTGGVVENLLGNADTGTVAGVTAAIILGTLCFLCVCSCCVVRKCIKSGRCPKRLRLLLAGYTLEANLISKTKLVNEYPMHEASGVPEEDASALEACAEVAPEVAPTRTSKSSACQPLRTAN